MRAIVQGSQISPRKKNFMPYVITEACTGEHTECTGKHTECTECVDACPVQCIYTRRNGAKPKHYIDAEQCINCGACALACPEENVLSVQPGTHLAPTAWRPSPERVASANMTHFMAKAEVVAGRKLNNYHALWQWSVDQPVDFWSLVWEFCGVIGEETGPVLRDGDQHDGRQLLPDARLNFAENLLRRNDSARSAGVLGRGQGRRRISWAELNERSLECSRR